MGFFANLFQSSDNLKRDVFSVEMLRSLRSDEGKNVVISIDLETTFPSPPFRGPAKKTSKNGKLLFSKMFNGVSTVTTDTLKLDNSAAIHKPKFDLGYETELDYVLTIFSSNGRWVLEYFDKISQKKTVVHFEGFMYFGGR